MSGRTAVIAVVTSLALPTGAAAQAPPSVSPLAGAAGCVVADVPPVPGPPAPDCVKARALGNVSALLLSPDERHLYASSFGGAVITLTRAADTGALAFASCVSDTGDDGRVGTEGFCTDGDALAGAADVAMSPDGRFAYVVATFSNAVAWLERDPLSGALTPRGCLKLSPRGDHCGAALGLDAPSDVQLSPDGRHVYIAGGSSVTWFARDAETGALSIGGCISDSGSDGRCANGTALSGAWDLVFSPDGATLYAATPDRGAAPGGGAVTALSRDPATGALAMHGCALFAATPGGACSALPYSTSPSGLAMAPDGSQLLMASNDGSALTALSPGTLALGACFAHADPVGDDREVIDEEEEDGDGEEDARLAQPPTCTLTRALAGVTAVAVSRDGRAVYTSGSFFTAFRRDPATGALEPFACLESYPTYKACQQHDKGTLGDVVTTADGRNVYATSQTGLSVFAASVAVRNRTARLSRSGRIGVRLSCPAARANGCRGTIARTRYRVARGTTATVPVRLRGRERALVRRRGRAEIVVTARDADRIVRAAGRRVLVSAR